MRTTAWKLVGVGLAAVVVIACGRGATGTVALGIKDGPPTSSDGRTITSLEIDVTRISLERGDQSTTAADAGQPQANEDVVAFDAGTGAPKTIDLLKVTTFSELVATLQIPTGTYESSEVVISGARVVFADAPTVTVPLTLDGDGRSKAEFHFHFKPAVTVSATGSTLAVIDFVPVVVKDSSGSYRLNHDGEKDDSGEKSNGGDVEMKGTIATLDTVAHTLTLAGSSTVVVFTNARIDLGSATAALAVGLKVEVEGAYDPASGHLLATSVQLK
jgi:hypothetical protein